MFALRIRTIRTLAVAAAIATGLAFVPHAASSETSPIEAGRVLDVDSGLPLAGATVVVSRSWLSDDDAAQISTSAVTAADGSFTVANVAPGPMNVQIIPKNGYPALHRGVEVAPGKNEGTLSLLKPSVAERNWLARINRERATFGLRAVVFDQGAIQSARYWAAYMARHRYFDHTMPHANQNAEAPGDDTPVTRYLKFSGLNLDATNGMSENIAQFDGDASWSDAEDMFMAERAKCPHGKPAGCKYTEDTGHFLNILNPDFKWIGLGISKAGGQTYYDQEFVVGA